MIRFLAVLFLLIPGIMAAVGIKWMRDALFAEFNPIFLHAGVQFTVGMVLFVGGLLFVGGFIVYRDRKQNKRAK